MPTLWAFNFHLRESSNLLFLSADDDDVLLIGFDRLNCLLGLPGLILAAGAAQNDGFRFLDRYEPSPTLRTESHFSPNRPRQSRASLLKHSEEGNAGGLV